ncbi:DNA adenine methylase [Streptococcus sp. H31]|uniref:DNA adenine methylase n=1 Tax=Streptococcus huangxiaojuni TaxID=3237239 RepID=UPI0034A3A916
MVKSLLRYPGSKWNLSSKIVDLLPEHKSYLEPYFGSGAVLFSKSVAPIETVNDLDSDVVNLFRVIQSSSKELQEKLFLTPYSRDVYNVAWKNSSLNEVDRALNFLIKSLMSHGFRVNDKSGWKNDIIGRERAYAVKHWNDLPDIIWEYVMRLKGVQIENRPALELIERFDYSDVCMYIDPPYVLSTRNRKQYNCEMTDRDHEELLELINKSSAKIVLSGYDSDLYNRYLSNWERLEFAAVAEGGLFRTEVLWLNFQLDHQLSLF